MLSGPERFAREIAALSTAFQRAADMLLRLLLRVLDSFRTDTPETPERAVREAESGISEVGEGLRAMIREWVSAAPRIYIAGHRDAGGKAESPEDFDADFRSSLGVQVSMLTSRLLEASDSMQRDALATLRNIALRRVQAAILGEEGVGREADAFRQEIEERGIKIRDRIGKQIDPKNYSEMLLLTATGDILNSGHLETASKLGAPGVRVRDGGGPNECEPCAKVDGEIWSISAAMRARLEHPRCRRTFSSMPSSWDGELDRV